MSYWDNITKIYEKQRNKGISEYGQTLEENTSLTFNERIDYIEEELVDALVYLEHLRAKKEDKRRVLNDFGNWLAENGYESSCHNIKAWITEYENKDKKEQEND